MPGLGVMYVPVFRGDIEITENDQPVVLLQLCTDVIRHPFQPVQLVDKFFTADFLPIDDIQVQHPDAINRGSQYAALRIVERRDIGNHLVRFHSTDNGNTVVGLLPGVDDPVAGCLDFPDGKVLVGQLGFLQAQDVCL